MRQKLVLFLAMCLLLSGCAREEHSDAPPEGQYTVYFAATQGNAEGSALGYEFRTLPAGKGALEGLVRLLLSGPESAELTSPFPQETSLRSWREEDGVAFIDLSEAYGGLSGIDLTLADSCVVLTLCQLDSIEAVSLTVEGAARPFRAQILRPEDLLLDNGGKGPETVEAELWFFSGEGLERENRTLKLAVGDDPVIAAVQTLMKGPETSGLSDACPQGSQLLELKRNGTSVSVDLNGTWAEGEQDVRKLYAIVNTISGMVPGAEVRFLVEGQPLEKYGGLSLAEPLREELSLEGSE